MWLMVLCAFLVVVVLVLAGRLYSVRRAADEIGLAFSEKLCGDTNTLITVSTGDPAMRRLAAVLNVQLEELRRQRHRYEQGDRELKNAVTNISHDLRTPLTAIDSYLDLLEDTEKSDAACRYLAVIRNRTTALEQMTSELFEYSVITSPESGMTPESICVNAVLEESVLAFYPVLQERQIVPLIRMTEHKVMRSLDRAAISRVFSNLLNNAVKYSGGDLEITLDDDGSVCFSNSAPELGEVQVEQLFDRFYTVEGARKSTGLGLSIVRSLVKRMGGSVSAVLEGQRLSIRLCLPE